MQRRRISGETKARRQTFPPRGHFRKSLKDGNLSDTRRSEDLFTNQRPRRHPAQVKNPQRFYFQGACSELKNVCNVSSWSAGGSDSRSLKIRKKEVVVLCC
ncbi:hypothetical protein AMECASPLE_032339 [Ameca splendens]|uniref:Uncharacterized protein n=1 Tax=Ameca splendens TaxID=208324 RepID=A0ABV0XVJ5_9TELE